MASHNLIKMSPLGDLDQLHHNIFGKFLRNCTTGSFSRRAQLHEVITNTYIYIIYSILSFTDFFYVLNMFYQATYFHCEFHIFFSLQNCNPHKYEEFIVITVTYDHQNPLQLKCIMLRNIKWLWMRLSQTTVWCQFGSWPKNWWITQQAWTPMNLQYEMKIIIKPFT